MTAEERLAYFQGEKRRNTSYDRGKSEKNMDMIGNRKILGKCIRKTTS